MKDHELTRSWRKRSACVRGEVWCAYHESKPGNYTINGLHKQRTYIKQLIQQKTVVVGLRFYKRNECVDCLFCPDPCLLPSPNLTTSNDRTEQGSQCAESHGKHAMKLQTDGKSVIVVLLEGGNQ